MEKEVKKILEQQGWWIDKATDGWNLSKYSPLGEDFEFYVSNRNLLLDIKEFVETFDADVHARSVMHFASGKDRPMSIIEIAHDAEAIDKMLRELLTALIQRFPELCEPDGSETCEEE